MLGQHGLDSCVVQKLVFGHSEDFKGLVLCDEATFNPEALFCDLLAADVLVPLRLVLGMLLVQIIPHLLQSLGRS